MITLDGAIGEGGGQILRTSLALSILTGTPFRIENIRAGREKPGLLRQHLTAVNAATAISGAETTGAELGSRTLDFRPGAVQPGTHTFAVGSAGSANLVLQTILFPLLFSGGRSKVKLDGGTHNGMSPPYPFLERVYAPLLARMGAEVALELVRWGFYPAGGGRIVADLRPVEALAPLHIPPRAPTADLSWQIRAAVSAIPDNVAQREITELCKALDRPRGEGKAIVVPDPLGPGNAAWVEIGWRDAQGAWAELFTGFGAKGVRAEQVARDLAAEVLRWRDGGAPVGEHLADQLLLPMALAGEGSFTTTDPTPHTLTNIEVIRRFLDTTFTLTPEGVGTRIEVRGTPKRAAPREP